MEHSKINQLAKLSLTRFARALGLAITGVALAAAGIHVGETDDAPGAALLGILLMLGALVFAIRIVRRRPHLDEEKG